MNILNQWLQVSPGTFIYVPEIITNRKFPVAAFDLMWTIVRPTKGRFSKTVDDIKFLPNRIKILKKYMDDGYLISIFTNNLTTSINEQLIAINRISYIMTQIGVIPWVGISTKSDIYRKPDIGMWEIFKQTVPYDLIDLDKSFYCGDAAGRIGDFADTDLNFGKNIGLKFYTPEEIFPPNEIPIPIEKGLFIFVGQPGAQKTTFADKYLKPKGWINIDSDEHKYKTEDKRIREAEKMMKQGKNISIDALHAKHSNRVPFINLVLKYNYNVTILYFVLNGYEYNKLRVNKVPDVVYNVYFKNLEEPSIELDKVPVIEIDRV